MMKNSERRQEERQARENYYRMVYDNFSRRELLLILNCINYADREPGGLPGHNLMIIIAKLCFFLGFDEDVASYIADYPKNNETG